MPEQPLAAPGPKPPETVLDAEPAEVRHALAQALGTADLAERRTAIAAVVAGRPTFLDGWAALSELGRDAIEGYAAARVGYHRGLDALRHGGWRGSGYVRWSHPENRGFLRCLAELARRADEIGERDESERCRMFLNQLDPEWPPTSRSRR
jgi:hypothetical protein